MQTVNEKTLTRQQMLKIWFIETGFDRARLARLAGISKQALHQALFKRPSASADFRDLCILQGIPAELLPPTKRKKADLLAENLTLKQRLAELTGQGEFQPQTHAG